MANVKKIIVPWSATGIIVYGIIRREVDGYLLNDADGAFANAPADPYVTIAEHGTIKGQYELSESRTVWTDGRYTIVAYKQTSGSPSPVADTIIGAGDMHIVSDLEVVADASVSTRAVESTVAKEVTLGVIAAYIDTEITTIINAITALQTDLGDPSVDATNIYAQVLAIKGYVDEIESRLSATRAGYLDNLAGGAVALNGTVAKEATNQAEHDVTQAAIAVLAPIPPFNIMSATKGAIQVSYAKTGGTVEVVKGDTISIPYGPLGKNITGRRLYFAAKNNLGDTTYSIAIKEITAQVTSFTTFTGTIPLTTAELALTPGNYYAEVESRDADGLSSPVTELKFILKAVDQVIV